MKHRSEHNRVDFNYFLIPMSIVLVLFFIFTYALVQRQIKTEYEHVEDVASKLTNSYAHTVVSQNLATETAIQLLEEKLEIAMSAILMIEHHWTEDVLNELGAKFSLDALYVYDASGTIRMSMNDEYIGWTAEPGHPVHNFLISSDNIRVEDIRRDTESNNYFKYGYIRSEDNEEFIQVGISAEKVSALLESFSIEQTINNIKDEANVKALSFINLDYSIAASTNDDYIGLRMVNKEDVIELNSIPIEVTRVSDNMLRVFVPVDHLGSK